MLWLLVALCATGVLISGYFTGVTFRWVDPKTRWIPPVCRMGEDTCAFVVFTPQARTFGPPNAVLGLLFYVVLAVAAMGGDSSRHRSAGCCSQPAASPWRWGCS